MCPVLVYSLESVELTKSQLVKVRTTRSSMLRIMSAKIWKSGCEVQLAEFEDEGEQSQGKLSTER